MSVGQLPANDLLLARCIVNMKIHKDNWRFERIEERYNSFGRRDRI